MQLDLPTLVTMGSFASACAGVVLLIAWWQHQDVPALALWALGNFVDTSGIFCLMVGPVLQRPALIMLADALVATEGSRSIALHAAWAVDALAPRDALSAASAAKAYCARAARTVCETAIQVHGGIGNTWECVAHVYLRRALTSTELWPVALKDIDLGLS